MYSENHQRPAVLVVEDEPLLRMDAVDMIEDAGFKTYQAGSADEALEMIRNIDDIGILFTDIDMPGTMDGLRLAACVHSDWPTISILIASGVVGVTDEVMPKGSKFYSKPYATGQIVRDMETITAAHAQGG